MVTKAIIELTDFSEGSGPCEREKTRRHSHGFLQERYPDHAQLSRQTALYDTYVRDIELKHAVISRFLAEHYDFINVRGGGDPS